MEPTSPSVWRSGSRKTARRVRGIVNLLGRAEGWASLPVNRAGSGYAACVMPQTSCHASKGLPSDWGSGRHGQTWGGIDGLEQLADAGPELAVEAGATNLEQEIGAAAGPSHLL
jgi:hypothetical protein